MTNDWQKSRLALYFTHKDIGCTKLPERLRTRIGAQFFWWTPAGSQPRSETRILAQAINLASFEDVRRLETVVGPQRLADVMLEAEPGWITDRSWDFWRGRLQLATGKGRTEGPPRRSFDAGAL